MHDHSEPSPEHVETIAQGMRALEWEERRARLESLRSEQPMLAAAVEIKLRASEPDADPLSPSTRDAAPTDPDATIVGTGPWSGQGLRPGTVIGTLRVVSLLGEGGMGEVYLAEDLRLDRQVALKSVRAGLREREASRERFLREARILSSLEHPGICRIYDLIEEEDADYIVLELIDGRSLDSATSKWNSRAKLGVVQDLARILAVAHAAGVVHRDLKPANVMVTPTGDVKVLDFGIARSLKGRDARQSLRPDSAGGTLATQDGAVAGTPMYMSPEQAAGEAVTAASDMFSLGLLLQELLTGESPREATSDPDTALRLARDGSRRKPRGLAPDVAALIRQLTARSPADRPTAVEAAQRLARIRAKPRRRAIGAGVTLALLVMAGGAVKYTIDLARERSIAVRERREVEQTMAFILEDLRPRLDEVGRLDVLQGAADLVLAYYSGRNVEELGERDLLLYARGLQLIGEVQLKQGTHAKALAAFERERDMLERLARKTPVDPDVLFSLSQAEYYIGELAFRSDDFLGALGQFREYERVAERLAAIDPKNPRWAMEVAYATSNQASMYNFLARQASPRGDEYERLNAELREESIRLKRDLVAEHAGFRPAVVALANDLSFRSGRRVAACDLAGARADATEAVSLVRAYVATSPEDNDARFRLCMVLSRAAGLARAAGELEESLMLYRRMQTQARALVEIEPDNAAWLQERAYGFMLEGAVLVDLGRYDEALPVLRAARTYLEDLHDRVPENGAAPRGLAHASLAEARAALAAGDPTAALAATQEGQRWLEGLDTPPARMAAAWLAITRGRAHKALGDAATATAAFEAAMDLVAPAPEADAEAAEIRATSLLRMGRRAEAERYLDRLATCAGVPPHLRELAGDGAEPP